MTKAANVFPAVGKDNEAGIIICSFLVGIAVGRAGLVLPRFWLKHTFSLLAPVSASIMVCHKKSFSSLLENNFFIRPFSVVGPYGRSTPVAVYSLAGACRLLFREVEGVDTQPVDIVIDMFDASCIFYQDVAGIVALGNAVLHRSLSVIVEILETFRRGCRYWAAFGMPHGNNAVQTDALLIHLVQYVASATWNLNTLSKGKRTWSLYRSMSPLSVHIN